jgi:hypothetical protein
VGRGKHQGHTLFCRRENLDRGVGIIDGFAVHNAFDVPKYGTSVTLRGQVSFDNAFVHALEMGSNYY